MSIMLAQSGVQDAVAGPAGIPVAFAVGMVSFFSPCVLPLVPGYLSYVSGISAQDLQSGADRGRLVGAIALFVLGFAVVFSAIGAGAGAFGGFVSQNEQTLLRVSGAIIIVLGLGFLSTTAIPRLQRWQRSDGFTGAVGSAGIRFARVFAVERGLHRRVNAGVAGAFPLGAAFAIGWTPCVGPGLGAIITMAATEGSAARGSVLMFAFSLGFGAWFLLGGLAFRRASRAFSAVQRHLGVLSAIGGTMMLAIGVLMLAGLWDDVLAPLRGLLRWAPPV